MIRPEIAFANASMNASMNLQAVSSHQSGIVLTEYLIGTLFVALALFAPMPGLGESAFTFLLESLRGFQANTTYLMSMP
ncbi:MAG: hypothetical protein AB8B97_27985 [Granulosicoccus sp.]